MSIRQTPPHQHGDEAGGVGLAEEFADVAQAGIAVVGSVVVLSLAPKLRTWERSVSGEAVLRGEV